MCHFSLCGKSGSKPEQGEGYSEILSGLQHVKYCTNFSLTLMHIS